MESLVRVDLEELRLGVYDKRWGEVDQARFWNIYQCKEY